MNDVEFYLEDLKSKFAKINPKEYYLAYSGGKDSHFLYWFIKEYLHDTDIEIVAVNTRLEFPEISARMYKYADKVLLPKLKPHEVIEKYGTPMFSKNSDDIISRYQNGSRTEATMNYINKTKNGGFTMFGLNKTARELLLADKLPKISAKCCLYMKKKPFKDYEKESGRKAIMGIMSSESMMRKAQYKTCFTKQGKFTPIHDMTEELMNKIYKKYNIELPKIYDYINQTGCAGCPYGLGLHHTETELQLMTPAKRRYVISLFGEAYKIRGLDVNQTCIWDFLEENLNETKTK